MILWIRYGGGVEKAELRVKRSAKNKKAEKKQEATILMNFDECETDEFIAHQNKVQWASGLLYRP